ncbi:gamma-glutamyltransferase family protein [Paraburkholderia caballeronis]|uniref:Gamma-glutamyltransferase 2. Threonine peptidase. MEROPS family T03 n=1 Tax=Paraburkholderia caballeronis TaxID=416943 RepID=A0A1H7PAQ4_9BURK|nr:gamma-glutamyltransferase family protein [Paraburkholderia caballeronis]PXW25321.1 gamma-glutamyltransferase 2 [Paraburkholderia caballeronis]PXX00928.1 gamma-glutamyltransferase 2 [Paraburkholderia caballeronis]RAJ99719.1 gamma-glutamyltransferase 2 [Paraburkholderia caballeronis]SEE42015.1 gamma-glutamyltransferase 2. Threonine peptidase. MEROPS family T03 [Paraburkholderia caballeronis]SEL32518.1 gamma-glutamyltransferase 2. Threonine peptidase. MEROPS family T03 [Paraburkholderia caball
MTRFDWQNPYPTPRLPVFARNVVSTSHPLAAQAGLRMLWKGGNAIDAALAAAAAITVVEPVSCGLGGDAFALVWDGAKLHGLNASGVAPAAWNVDYFRRRHGEDANGIAKQPVRGWDAVTVPGVIAGWEALHAKFGTLPFADLLEPAIEIAERGHALASVVARKWAAAVPELRNQPGFADTFMPNGRAPEVSELVRLPGHARTLRLLAEHGPRAYYEGEIAERIAAFAREGGGAMTADDLRHYRADWVEPIGQDYRGYTVHEIPPNGQGIAALIALGILEHFDLGALPLDGVESQHLQIEAMKLAFADVYRYVADPRSMDVTPEQMLDPAYLAQRAKLIDPRRATHFGFGMPKAGGTIYLSAADERGMMVSFIQSNYMGFGSGVVVPGMGIALQNRGCGFSMDPRSPNVVEGGKRPFHTIIPAFLTQRVEGRQEAVMSFGVMGGDMQPQGHLQTVVRMLDYGQQPQAACDAPRWKVNRDFTLDVEATLDADCAKALAECGHTIKSIDDPYMDFGSGQFVWRLDRDEPERGYVAASDSRRDGLAAGF